MTRPPLPALLIPLLVLAVVGVPARGGWPRKGGHAHPTVVGVPATPAGTYASARPRYLVTPTGVTDVPALGTFYPTPSMVVVTGPPGTTYTPAGIYSDVGAMAVYGPASRFRPRVAEAVVYGRGYDGSIRPTGAATVFTYPGLDPRASRPDTYRLSDYGTPRPAQTSPRGRTPFLVGEY